MIKVGTKQIVGVFKGDSPIQRIYKGDTIVYERPVTTSSDNKDQNSGQNADDVQNDGPSVEDDEQDSEDEHHDEDDDSKVRLISPIHECPGAWSKARYTPYSWNTVMLDAYLGRTSKGEPPLDYIEKDYWRKIVIDDRENSWLK